MPGIELANAVGGIVLGDVRIARSRTAAQRVCHHRRNAEARCGSWPSSATLPGHSPASWSPAPWAPTKFAFMSRLNQAGRPKPPSWPVLSSKISVWLPSALAVESWMRAGPSLPMMAVSKPLGAAAGEQRGLRSGNCRRTSGSFPSAPCRFPKLASGAPFRADQRRAGVDVITEIAGVADVMAGGDGRWHSPW